MRADKTPSAEVTPEIRRGAVAWIVKALFGLLFIGSLLFWLAGTTTWAWGWAFLALFGIASLVHAAVLWRTSPALLAKRSRGVREEGAPTWDRVLVSMGAGLLPMTSWFLSAADERFRWAPAMPDGFHWLGVLGFLAGWTLILWATFSNRFFSTTVHLEAAHSVQTGGPYRWIRHPGYLGAIIYQAAAPMLLGSWWGLVFGAASLPLMVLRTALEDRFLHDRLPGYGDYAGRVRFRLLPGLW